jgi:hypothetical protein
MSLAGGNIAAGLESETAWRCTSRTTQGMCEHFSYNESYDESYNARDRTMQGMCETDNDGVAWLAGLGVLRQDARRKGSSAAALQVRMRPAPAHPPSVPCLPFTSSPDSPLSLSTSGPEEGGTAEGGRCRWARPARCCWRVCFRHDLHPIPPLGGGHPPPAADSHPRPHAFRPRGPLRFAGSRRPARPSPLRSADFAARQALTFRAPPLSVPLQIPPLPSPEGVSVRSARLRCGCRAMKLERIRYYPYY